MFSVLIVEDDKELSELYCTVLSDNGYKVYTAQNGEIALKIIHESYIDLMICDVMMPKMDGYELTKQLLEDEAEYSRMSKSSNPYGDGHASKYIVDAIIEKFAEIANMCN